MKALPVVPRAVEILSVAPGGCEGPVKLTRQFMGLRQVISFVHEQQIGARHMKEGTSESFT